MTAPPFRERLHVAIKRPEFYIPVVVEIAALILFIGLPVDRTPASYWMHVVCLFVVVAAMVSSLLLSARRQLAPKNGYRRTPRGRA